MHYKASSYLLQMWHNRTHVPWVPTKPRKPSTTNSHTTNNRFSGRTSGGRFGANVECNGQGRINGSNVRSSWPAWQAKPSDSGTSEIWMYNGSTFYWCSICKHWHTTHSTNGIPANNIPCHTNITKSSGPSTAYLGNYATLDLDDTIFDWWWCGEVGAPTSLPPPRNTTVVSSDLSCPYQLFQFVSVCLRSFTNGAARSARSRKGLTCSQSHAMKEVNLSIGSISIIEPNSPIEKPISSILVVTPRMWYQYDAPVFRGHNKPKCIGKPCYGRSGDQTPTSSPSYRNPSRGFPNSRFP